MTLAEQLQRDRLLNAVNMTHARFRALLATALAATQRAQSGLPVVDDIRILCADISLMQGWLEGESLAVSSGAPQQSGAPDDQAGAVSGPVVH
ncbi:MAG: hypothetical protein EPN70_00695 [Paraburkholderia sp.]|uniref:hypothetical protein n=1 Tax=Paraburkholderia sp. TaxID=1926495 RepID=UPI0012082160|nr:hypothetical protein [Paraburkholderia sp.]TAM08292.1 MAG: hypothetical protein EPN70_00695 [Paraburkholderia sp.]TAM28054.1 MAG: hypothetical protein EPN59_17950 [Paraburkholderia sp.]